MNDPILDEQLAYYKGRASEYDEWHLRLGRYNRGEAHKRQWFSELNSIRTALNQEKPFGDCLELACGTGLWTGDLATGADSITAIDAAPETIAINRSKNSNSIINFEVADIFEWKPFRLYDFVFFGFWLSHVPPDRFNGFWDMIRSALKPAGRVFLVDSLQNQDSTAKNHAEIGNSGFVERKLNDGQTFNIVKIFYGPVELTHQLLGIGFKGYIHSTGNYFYYGCVTPE